MDIKHILEKTKTWKEKKLQQDKDYFAKLSKTKKTEILYIGCSDSRIVPELMLGMEPGDLFVHRNIANQVNNGDANSSAAIEYAVKALKVKHIILCGHYGCAGVQAALQSTSLKKVDHWLKSVKTILKEQQKELDALPDTEKKLDRLVELNVQRQGNNLTTMDCIKKAQEETGFPKIHTWVFDLRKGDMLDLGF